MKRTVLKRLAEAMLLAVAMLLLPEAYAQDITALAKRILPSVVTIRVKDGSGQVVKTGSGFVISKDHIATNQHVIFGAASVTVEFADGRSEIGWGSDTNLGEKDLFVIVAKTSSVPALPLNNGQTEIGTKVYAFGSPLGLSGSVSEGIVSGIRSYQGSKIYQTTAPISPGSSGGPLVDIKGKVVGVTSFTLENGQNLNFAYSSYYLTEALGRGTGSVLLLDKFPAYFPVSAIYAVDAKRFRASRRIFVIVDSVTGNLYDATAADKATNNDVSDSASSLLNKLGWSVIGIYEGNDYSAPDADDRVVIKVSKNRLDGILRESKIPTYYLTVAYLAKGDEKQCLWIRIKDITPPVNDFTEKTLPLTVGYYVDQICHEMRTCADFKQR